MDQRMRTDLFAQCRRHNDYLLKSARVAQDVLNKRSTTTSDRPRMVMANELVTKGMNILLRSYDARYVTQQRMHASVLSLSASSSYANFHERETLRLLRNVLRAFTLIQSQTSSNTSAVAV